MATTNNEERPVEEERRKFDEGSRSTRLTLATASTPLGVAVAVLSTEIVKMCCDVRMSNMAFLSIAAISGSLTTTMALCFHDMRAIFLARFLKRRQTDRRRK